MNNKYHPYCQLKYSCSFDFKENHSLRKPKEKSPYLDFEEEFYVEEYPDFESLIFRIKNIYDEIIKDYAARGIDKYSDQCSFPEFFICNRYGNSLSIGICAYGWRILSLFSVYLQKYLENKYGKDQGKNRYLQLTVKNDVYFYWDLNSEPNIFSASDLVSEETARIILKEFLNTGKTEFDTDFCAVYDQEIAKRNY